MSEYQGCSDGNCLLRLTPLRQHTNGGCRCLRDVARPLRHAIMRKIRSQRVEIERLMRELARRLKRIGACWTARGAAKMARIVIKRLLSPKKWEDYWNRRMRINGRCVFIIRGVNPSDA